MRVRILGGGWYGCHLAMALRLEGMDVELLETAPRLFSGASGGNPARLHLGFHYPRSHATRQACQAHVAEFMRRYGFLTRSVAVNLYAVAAQDSWVDFGTYHQVMKSEGLPCFRAEDPAEFGLQNVEGALVTGERHIVIDEARAWFALQLGEVVEYGVPRAALLDDDPTRWTIDCTFCSYEGERIDRYEPCVTGLVEGPTDRAVTIMDGPFPSLYPWNEEQRLCSLTSAKLTPLATCATWDEAQAVIRNTPAEEVDARVRAMADQLAEFWPGFRDQYRLGMAKLTIRAQPRSGSAARLVDVVRVGERRLRIRAGKIDAIMYAEQLVKGVLCSQ